jgi:hypothetical protein
MFFGPNGQFLHVWNVSWSKLAVSAWLEYVIEKTRKKVNCTRKNWKKKKKKTRCQLRRTR